MKNKFSIALSLAVILSLLLASLALADQINADADALVLDAPHGNGVTATQAAGTTVEYDFSAAIKETGNANDNVFPGSVTVTITRSGDWASGGGPASFSFSGYDEDHAGKIAITVPCDAVGTKTMSVTLVAGTSSNGKNLNPNSVTLSYVITAGANDPSCTPPPPANTAPSLSLPADMTVEGDTIGGANVSYAVSAADAEDGALTPNCVPASGSFFPLGTTTVNCSVTDSGGLSDSGSFQVTVEDTTAPSITCPADVSGTVGQVVALGSPTVSDIVDAAPTVGNDAPSSFGPGLTTVKWTATDDSTNSASCFQKVNLTYVWNGFFQPVDNELVNKAKAGQAIPFKWALQDANGNFVSDLGVVEQFGFGSGLSCGGTTDTIESYDTSGNSGLRYDLDANQFVLSAKSDKGWAGLCKVFFVVLDDGTTHQAKFTFVK